MTVNKVILVGNLGADPEVRQSGSGLSIAKLRLATTERVKKGDAWENHTEWHRVTAFGKTAENVQKYCQKGKQLYIEGRIRTSEYNDKDGNKRWSTEVIADTVRFLGSKGEGGGGGQSSGGYGGGSSGGGGGYSRPRGEHGGAQADASEDIPF